MDNITNIDKTTSHKSGHLEKLRQSKRRLNIILQHSYDIEAPQEYKDKLIEIGDFIDNQY